MTPALREVAPDDAPRVITAANLLSEFKPIESIVDGLPIPRGGLTLLTANTGHGKTTIATLLEVALVRGHAFAQRDATRGAVLVLAGENPDDFAMHLAATAQDLHLTGEDLCVQHNTLLVVPGVFRVDFEFDRLARDCGRADGLVAVIVDTSAAFFQADEENDNVSQRRHASMFRELTRLPGRPAVIVLCHPAKRAARDNLLPRGGGAFLNECDANLTLWKDDGSDVVELHWLGKIRGQAFDPIRFELVPVKLEGYSDSRGRPIWSSTARHLRDDRAEQIVARELDDGDRLLLAMVRKPDDSQEQWRLACGFTNRSKVNRLLAGFVADGIAKKARGGVYRLTPAGTREAGLVATK